MSEPLLCPLCGEKFHGMEGPCPKYKRQPAASEWRCPCGNPACDGVHGVCDTRQPAPTATAQQETQYHSGEGCCADPKCGNDCHHGSAEPIGQPAAQQDALRTCDICGGRLVSIRGRFPHTPDRIVCPTCLAETQDMIREMLNPNYARAALAATEDKA